MASKFLLTSSLLLLGALTAFAQPGPGPGGPGGGFGFGPPGFGPGGFGGPGMFGGARRPATTSSLLTMPEVRKELAITEEQQKQLDEALAKSATTFREAIGDFNPAEFGNLDEEQRQQRMEEMRKRSEEAAQKVDADLEKLLTKEQAARIAELRLQRDGAAALLRPELAKQLELTEEQQAKLKELDTASRPSFGPPGGGPPGGGFGGPPDFARMEQTRQKAQADMLALLNEKQKGTWESLAGKAFTFPAPQFGRGGPGGMGGTEKKLLTKFDKDGDKRLDRAERDAARESIKQERASGGGRGFGGGPGGPGFGPPGGGGFGGPGGGRGGNREPAKPGPKVAQVDVQNYPDAKLYDAGILRTIFLDFEHPDWEAEMADFNNSDIEIPVVMTVDGKKYENVGAHFRGMSSFGMVPAGYKRSLNLSLDFVNPEQRLYGYKTLNLLNCNGDPSLLSSILYSHIARQHIPAPKANLVKVVINGEYWGVYANLQQFNKEFLDENYGDSKGARWKVRGSPNGSGGLEFTGDNIEEYRRRFEIKSGDNNKSWKALIELCRVLNETPAADLPAAIEPILDVDSVLWFLALDVALVNSDGYWTRASDYSIYRDSKGKFHVIPHDMNEAFHGSMGFGPPGGGPGGPGGRRPGAEGRPGGEGRTEGRAEGRSKEAGSGENRGPGRQGGPRGGGPGGGPGGGGIELDPLVSLEDSRKPLRSKLLQVPAYRTRYLQHVKAIAEESLDWKNLGPVVAQYRNLVEEPLRQDTRKLASDESFAYVTADEPKEEAGRGREIPLRTFADKRRAFLLNHPEIKKVVP